MKAYRFAGPLLGLTVLFSLGAVPPVAAQTIEFDVPADTPSQATGSYHVTLTRTCPDSFEIRVRGNNDGNVTDPDGPGPQQEKFPVHELLLLFLDTSAQTVPVSALSGGTTAGGAFTGGAWDVALNLGSSSFSAFAAASDALWIGAFGENEFIGSCTLANPNAVTVYVLMSGGSGHDWVLGVALPSAQAPQIACPAATAVPADGNCQATVPDLTAAAMVTYDCPDPIGVTQSPLPGTVVGPGVHLITLTAMDATGNSSRCTTPFTVADTTPPSFTNCPPAPASAIATCTPDGIGAVVNFPPLAATDNCGAASVSYDHAPGSLFPPGSTQVTATALDAAGNSTPCAFTVTVAYAWSGVLQPLNADGSSIFKLGSTIPVKVALTGDSACITNGVFKLYLTKLGSAATGSDLEAVSTSAADSGNTFRYDSNTGQYVFNLGTKGLTEGTWQLRIDLGDGSTNTVQFSLKK
jgi:hypothetical protein